MDELRHLPHNIEAEQGVLGSMLLDSRCIPEVIETLHVDDFYLRAHKDIFDTLYSMFVSGAVIDPLTLLGEMKARGAYEENTSRDYVGRLMDITPTAAHVKHYVSLVREQAILRQVAEAATDIQAMVAENPGNADAVLDGAEQRIYDIRKGRGNTSLYRMPQVLIEVYQKMKELSAAGGHLPGLSTGLSDVDHIIGGLVNSNFILIASRPGMGKTSIALNIALNAARSSGKAAVFFSLEMSRDQLVTRMLSSEARVDSRTLSTGMLTNQQWSQVGAASAELSKAAILFDDNPAISVAEMKAKCRRVQDLGLIVIDYLQLMQGHGSRKFDNRTTEVAEISRSLKIMAKELNVPVLCLSQLSRETEKRGNKKPILSDLRESGAIEQDADVVMFLYREEYYELSDDNHNAAEVIVAKNRHGETGSVSLRWDGLYTSFTSSDWKHNEE